MSIKRIIYILLYPLIFIFSRLPFWLLYKLSDFLYLVIYYLFGYRKKVVRHNLSLAFPDKPKTERLKIEKKFYKHFADIFIEMIKAFSISNKQMQKHYVFNNVDLLNQITDKNQNVVIVGGHYANWEWVISLATITKALPVATYLKINNPYFEKSMLKNRSRFGGLLVETKQLRKRLEVLSNKNQTFILGLLADQSPQRHRAKYWRSFFGNEEVPVFTGPENITKKYQAAYVFMKVSKIKRGYYEVDFELITTKPKQYPDYELTDIFIEKLEKQIRQEPAYYLWTHNRFKHMGKQPKKWS